MTAPLRVFPFGHASCWMNVEMISGKHLIHGSSTHLSSWLQVAPAHVLFICQRWAPDTAAVQGSETFWATAVGRSSTRTGALFFFYHGLTVEVASFGELLKPNVRQKNFNFSSIHIDSGPPRISSNGFWTLLDMYSAVGLVDSPKLSESEAQRQSADQREELQKMRQVAGAVGTKMAMGSWVKPCFSPSDQRFLGTKFWVPK